MLKPSEALRIGMKKHRQAVGYLYAEGGHQGHGATCALGAIGVGYGMSIQKLKDELIYGKIKLLQQEVVNPAEAEEWDEEVDGELSKDTIEDTIVSLNDDYGWNRGRIARWLEKIGL